MCLKLSDAELKACLRQKIEFLFNETLSTGNYAGSVGRGVRLVRSAPENKVDHREASIAFKIKKSLIPGFARENHLDIEKKSLTCGYYIYFQENLTRIEDFQANVVVLRNIKRSRIKKKIKILQNMN